MQTTKMILEYLAAGVLVTFALVLLGVSYLEDEIQQAIEQSQGSQSSLLAYLRDNQAAMAVLATAAVYVMGAVFEFLGRVSFEWLLDREKKNQMATYIKNNQPSLRKSPILDSFRLAPTPLTRDDQTKAAKCMGDMRFHVLMKNPPLYTLIDRSMNRFRLLRVLLLVLCILIVAIVKQLFGPTPILAGCSLLVVTGLAVATFFAIRGSFERYCRAIARAYKVLVLDPDAKE